MNRMPPATPEFSLRPARPGDDEFALGMYLVITRGFLSSHSGWNDDLITERFRKGYDPSQVQIVCADGMDVGWMQVSESDDGLHLDQIHLIEAYRHRGIGTRLVRDLLARARHKRESVRLNVMRGNSAIEFYRRLGFAVTGSDEEKIQMRWDHVQPIE